MLDCDVESVAAHATPAALHDLLRQDASLSLGVQPSPAAARAVLRAFREQTLRELAGSAAVGGRVRALAAQGLEQAGADGGGGGAGGAANLKRAITARCKAVIQDHVAAAAAAADAPPVGRPPALRKQLSDEGKKLLSIGLRQDGDGESKSFSSAATAAEPRKTVPRRLLGPWRPEPPPSDLGEEVGLAWLDMHPDPGTLMMIRDQKEGFVRGLIWRVACRPGPCRHSALRLETEVEWVGVHIRICHDPRQHRFHLDPNGVAVAAGGAAGAAGAAGGGGGGGGAAGGAAGGGGDDEKGVDPRSAMHILLHRFEHALKRPVTYDDRMPGFPHEHAALPLAYSYWQAGEQGILNAALEDLNVGGPADDARVDPIRAVVEVWSQREGLCGVFGDSHADPYAPYPAPYISYSCAGPVDESDPWRHQTGGWSDHCRWEGYRWEVHRFRGQHLGPDVKDFSDFAALFLIVYSTFHPGFMVTADPDGGAGGTLRRGFLGFDNLESAANTHKTSMRDGRPITWGDLPELTDNTFCFQRAGVAQTDRMLTFGLEHMPPMDTVVDHVLLFPFCVDKTFLFESGGDYYMYRFRHVC